MYKAATRLGELTEGIQEYSESRAEDLIDDYINLLEKQSQESRRYTTFYELSEIASNFDLILAVNFPTVPYEPLKKLPRIFGPALARQTPVGGMAGRVNKSLVQQFRMPGYPLVLVTTDVLQEGEDLHTFCAQVVHYGIAWTPSALEQRTGRVDRIRSLTARRLQKATLPTQDDLLQVFYPHLHETIERLQVERVYERMNRFIRLLHKQLANDAAVSSYVNTESDMIMRPFQNDIEPIRGRLESPFGVKAEWLHINLPLVLTDAEELAKNSLQHFRHVIQYLIDGFEQTPEPQINDWSYFTTVFINPEGHLVTKDEKHQTARRQPLTLFLRSATNDQNILLRCVSPVGKVEWDDFDQMERVAAIHQNVGFGKICALSDAKKQTYDLTIEMDILFHPDSSQPAEVAKLVERTSSSADQIEQALFGFDHSMEDFRTDLLKEPKRG